MHVNKNIATYDRVRFVRPNWQVFNKFIDIFFSFKIKFYYKKKYNDMLAIVDLTSKLYHDEVIMCVSTRP